MLLCRYIYNNGCHGDQLDKTIQANVQDKNVLATLVRVTLLSSRQKWNCKTRQEMTVWTPNLVHPQLPALASCFSSMWPQSRYHIVNGREIYIAWLVSLLICNSSEAKFASNVQDQHEYVWALTCAKIKWQQNNTCDVTILSHVSKAT